jgi:hypothetical protein
VTTSAAITSTTFASATLEEAEASWLAAIQISVDAQRQLMLKDAVVVHGAVGAVDDVETFLSHSATMGRIVSVEVSEVNVREHEGIGIVTCHQKMQVKSVPTMAPFLVQAAVTRAWFPDDGGWKLGHMQLSRRMPG